MKDVFINIYEGGVLIEDVPNNVKEEKLANIALYELGLHQGKIITSLSNYNYISNPIVLECEKYLDLKSYGELSDKMVNEELVTLKLKYSDIK